MKNLPEAIIVPNSTINSCKLAKNNYFPTPTWTKIIIKFDQSIRNDLNQLDYIITKIESKIKKSIIINSLFEGELL